MTGNKSSNQAIRNELRQRRRALTGPDQLLASENLFMNLLQMHEVRCANHVACYLPTNGEIDPTPLIDWALGRGKRCYLPVLSHIDGNRLWFAPVDYQTPMGVNRFNIPEPQVPIRQMVRARRLDLVILPLVGFDTQCNRLGMGGGYYDRSLQQMRYRRHWRKPRLIGVAHDLQKVDAIDVQPWDVPLDAIVTDQTTYWPRRKNDG